MCDRCGAGFTFFGLAEPQTALLDAYAAALKSGWQPKGSATAAELLAAIAADADAFVTQRADAVVRADAEAGATAARSIRLIRWLWDGEFCGEASLTYNAAAAPQDRVCLSTSIVSAKDGLGYDERARRHILLEARELGVAAVDLDRAELQATSRRQK